MSSHELLGGNSLTTTRWPTPLAGQHTAVSPKPSPQTPPLQGTYPWAIADVPLKQMPAALERLEVPFGDMVSLSEAVLADRTRIRPGVRARHALERVILTKTFQSSRGVEEGMLLLGVRNGFQVTCKAT